jgi:hypothetical protein
VGEVEDAGVAHIDGFVGMGCEPVGDMIELRKSDVEMFGDMLRTLSERCLPETGLIEDREVHCKRHPEVFIPICNESCSLL